MHTVTLRHWWCRLDGSPFDAGTRGTYLIDGFESRSSSFIGLDLGAPPLLGRVPPADSVFSDGFETTTLDRWSASVTDSGDLGVASAAALFGGNGLQAVLDDNVSIYLTDWSPFAEKRYRTRFHFDPNTIVMASGNAHYLLYAYVGDTTTGALRLEFRYSGGYQVRAEVATDTTSWVGTAWYTITDAPHAFELDWKASSAPLANNGSLTLWIDGAKETPVTGVDNDTRTIDYVRLGAVSGIDTGTRGTYFFDAFASTRASYLGPHAENLAASFVYDGDGRRIKSVVNGVTTILVGDHYEVRTDGDGETTRETYFAGGRPVAVRELPSGTLFWLITDHLGSLMAAADASGALTAELRYAAFGVPRYTAGVLPTTYQYTFQRSEPLLGLYDYRARWYDPGAGRFTQADTIVPAAGSSMAWDRYAYVLGNPARNTDPTGHYICEGPDYCSPNRYHTYSRRELIEEIAADYGIEFQGDQGAWSLENMSSVIAGVHDVASALASELGGTPAEAFRAVYGHVSFLWGTHNTSPAAGSLSSVCSQIGVGGCTSSAHLINFALMAYATEIRSPALANALRVHNVVHELGHAFASLFRSGSPVSPYTMTKAREELLSPRGFAASPVGASLLWRQNPSNAGEEIFADMFLGWTYATWEGSAMGEARAAFMTNMTEGAMWIWRAALP